jgi:hypothetical protein
MKKVMLLGLMAVAMLIVAPMVYAADTEKPKDEGGKGKRGPQVTEDQQKELQPAVDAYTPAAKAFKEAVAKVLTEEKTANAFIMQTLRKGQPVREGKEPPKGPEITDDQKKALEPAVTKFEPALADFKAAVAKVLTDERQARMFVMMSSAKAMGITMGRPGGGEKGKDAPKAAEGAK